MVKSAIVVPVFVVTVLAVPVGVAVDYPRTDAPGERDCFFLTKLRSKKP